MPVLEGNPFINWKKVQVNYKGKPYEFYVKAFECNIAFRGIGYHLKFKDSYISIANINSKWVRLDENNDFATAVGHVIDQRISEVWRKFLENSKQERRENKSKSSLGNWGIGLKDK
jgi:hypothetical protein